VVTQGTVVVDRKRESKVVDQCDRFDGDVLHVRAECPGD
jgi:hypothetical protein